MNNIYKNGKYLENNPSWHTEDSSWKAEKILKAITRNNLKPRMIVDIGCGAGLVLSNLRKSLPKYCQLLGIDISKDAIAMAKKNKITGLDFKVGDYSNIPSNCDLILVIDVLEHLEDCEHFFKQIKAKSRTIIFHIPLEKNLYSLLKFRELRTRREALGHIQFFSKRTAIEMIQNAGFKIIDQFYTPWILELRVSQRKKRIITFTLIKWLYRINSNFAALLGGSSLLIVAK